MNLQALFRQDFYKKVYSVQTIIDSVYPSHFNLIQLGIQIFGTWKKKAPKDLR